VRKEEREGGKGEGEKKERERGKRGERE